MAKEILYRIDFEGAESQLNNLTKIGDELQTIQKETKSLQKEQKILNELNKDLTDEQKKQLEELKIKQKIASEAYRKEQTAIKNNQKEYKAQAGTLEQLRLEAQKLGRQLETTWKVGTPEFKKAAAGLEEINRKIRNADKSAGNFKSNIGNYAGSIGDAFQGVGLNVGKLSGNITSLGAATAAGGPLGIGLAALVGGMQLFGSAIQSTDKLADAFAITMEKAKTVTSVFFKALAEGDFSNFITNIRTAIAEAERYAKAVDYLEDATRASTVSEAKYRNEIALLKIEMRDRTKTDEERIKAVEKIIAIENKIGNERLRLAKIEVDNELKNKATINQINKDKLKSLIENFSAYEKQFQFVEKLQDAEKRLAEEKARSGGGASGFEVADAGEVRRLQGVVDGLRRATAGYSAEIIAFGRVTAEERQKIADALTKQYEAEAYANEETIRAQTTRNGLMDEAFRTSEAFSKTVTTQLNTQAKAATDLQAALEKLIPTWGELIALSGKLSAKKPERKLPGLIAPDEELNVEDEIDTAGVVERLNQRFDINATVDAATQYAAIWSEAYQTREEELRISLEKGIISETKYQQESEKLQKKQANLQRVVAIAQLSADLARTVSALGLGAANTAKVGFPLNIPLLIAFAAQATGILANLKSIKFAKGGIVDIGGNSHAQGGTKFIGSDGSRFEAERGELLAIVNKHDSRTLRTLSDINSRHGRSFYGQPSGSYFATGGIYQPNANIGQVDTNKIIRDVISQIGTIPVAVSLNEIESKASLKRKVNVIGSL